MLKACSFLIGNFCHFLFLCIHLVWNVASKKQINIKVELFFVKPHCQIPFIFMVTDSSLPVPDVTPSLPYFPFSRSTPHGSTNMGGARHGSANQSPGLRSVSRLPPIRGGIVTRDVRVYSSGRLLSLVHTGLLLLAPCCRWLNWRVHSPARTHSQGLARAQGCLWQAGSVGTRSRAHARTHTDAGWSRAVLRWQEAEVQQGRPETFANYFRDKRTNWDGDNVRPPAGCVLPAHLL